MIRKFIYTEIDFGKGWVFLDCFHISTTLSLNEQEDFLTEDLLAIAFGEGQYIIDIGWHSANRWHKKGSFQIKLVNNSNWSKPILEMRCYSLQELDNYLVKYVEFVREKTENYTKFPNIKDEFKINDKMSFISSYSSENRDD
ncbi:MAG: hypothetical protein K1X55_05030 [Chitinophagales bacterium]|nr:hypothetical protein [Chitinophagales bacterium]